MSKSIDKFTWFYKAKAAVKDALDLPRARRRCERALDSFSDDLEARTLAAQSKRDDLFSAFVRSGTEESAKGVAKQILELDADIQELEALATGALRLKAELSSDATSLGDPTGEKGASE